MSDYKISTGFWNNYSNSGWWSATLTLDVRSSALLIASLATFITIVGSRFWSIVAFTIHQLRTTNHRHDGVHHQHQVVYRNTSTQLGVVWLLIRIVWSWRGRASNNLIRFVIFSLPPLISFAGFTAAGIMSSRVAAPSYAASAVRVQPNNCGLLEYLPPDDPSFNFQSGSAIYGSWSTTKAREATNYARSCYGNSSQSLASCNVYPLKELPYTTKMDAKCPFNESRCSLGPDTAFQLSTSWLDSHEHLGMNAEHKNRIRFRKVVTCSVINVEDLIRAYPYVGSDTYEYYLGPRGSAVDGVISTNFTFAWRESTLYDGIPYSVSADKSVILDPYQSRGWQPSLEFNRTDADVSMIFLNSNSMIYLNPVKDPLFSANRVLTSQLPNGNFTYYGADKLTQILGCTDQFQIQNPNSNLATELTSSAKTYIQAAKIGLNLAQSATVLRLNLVSYDSLMFNSVNGLGAAALHAPDNAWQRLSPGLPDDQWRTEILGWFNASLVTLQDRVISYVSKDMTSMANVARLNVPSGFPELQSMCQNQAIKNIGAYQSFSMLGIGIIAVVGVFIIVLSWALEPLVGWVQNRSKKAGKNDGLTKHDQWLLDSAIHLQRMLVQRDGSGIEWSNCDGEVPVTAKNQTWFVSSDAPSYTPVTVQSK